MTETIKNGYAQAGLKVLPEHLLVKSEESYEKIVFKDHIRSADLNSRFLPSVVDERLLSV